MNEIPEILRTHMDFQLSLMNLLKEPHATAGGPAASALRPVSSVVRSGLDGESDFDMEGKLAELEAACV